MFKRFPIILLLVAVAFVPTTAQLDTSGALCVRVDRQQLSSIVPPEEDGLLIILDHSGSMEDLTRSGETRFRLAQTVLRSYIDDLPDDMQVGFRVYGYSGECEPSRLLYPISELDKSALLDLVNSLSSPDGGTPITEALNRIPSDFGGIGGNKEVLLVTDGQETCGGDPVAVASRLATNDPYLAIHVVGFDIADPVAQQNLRGIPRAARGTYIPVETEEDLLQALSVIIRVPFFVYDTQGNLLAQGLANRSTLSFEPGSYQVDVPEFEIEREELIVESGRGTALHVDARGRAEVIENDSLCIAEFCPDVPLPRLVIGQRGRVTTDPPVNQRVRSQPSLSGQILTLLDVGTEFDVLDGPVCKDGYLWWHIRNDQVEGWSAEGIPDAYYLEPWP